MKRIQIMISFDNGKWLCDFTTINEDQTVEEAIEAYIAQYEQVKGSMEIISKLLPGIIHISNMGE